MGSIPERQQALLQYPGHSLFAARVGRYRVLGAEALLSDTGIQVDGKGVGLFSSVACAKGSVLLVRDSGRLWAVVCIFRFGAQVETPMVSVQTNATLVSACAECHKVRGTSPWRPFGATISRLKSGRAAGCRATRITRTRSSSIAPDNRRPDS